jgi:molybdenum cofactor guanylyltransferase
VSAPLAVVVLAGGEGRRMGGAKPLARYGETTLIGRAVRLAQGWSPRVAVAVRTLDQLPELAGARSILDAPGIEGPLAGLAAALGFARDCGGDRVLTLPCDAPRLPADLASRLADGLGGRLAAIAESAGRLHPTCGLWRTAAEAKLAAYLATGRRSLHGFAEHCGAATVNWTIGPDGDPFANANTPEELAALQPPQRRT